MNHVSVRPLVLGLISESNRPRLMAKLRRVGGFIGLFVVFTFASVHWISQDIDSALAAKLPKAEMKARVGDALARLDAVLLVAGLAMLPVVGISLWLVSAFVRRHFAELEETNRRKSQLVRWVAHELKTPLNGVKGFADLLASGARGPMTPEQAACVTEIRGGVQHMRTMIGDLLDLARIEAGTIDLKPEDVTLAGLLAEALVVARPMAEGHKVALTAAGELSTEIHVDFGRTKQVLINLLSNAIKFSPEGAMVSVTGMASSGEVRITVSDAGPGISEEDQKKLFSEFGQVGAAGNPDGTGLGLAISRRLVELQGGRIWVESEPVRGTRFHVAFPAARGEAVDGVALVPATGVR